MGARLRALTLHHPGSSHIITPNAYIEDLAKLRQPLVIPDAPKIQLMNASDVGAREMTAASEKKKGGLFSRLLGK